MLVNVRDAAARRRTGEFLAGVGRDRTRGAQGARRIGTTGRDQPAENAKQDVPSEVRLTR